MEAPITLIWIDYVIFAIIALSAIIGLFRGFVREALSLVAWGAAIWVALTFAPLAASYLEPYLETPSLRNIAAFAGLFLATLIAGAIINYLVSLLVTKSGIGGTDRFLGLIFGVARGALVVVILVMLAGLTSLPDDPWWKASKVMPYFEEMAVTLSGFLPEDIGKDFVFDPGAIIGDTMSVDAGGSTAGATPAAADNVPAAAPAAAPASGQPATKQP